MAVLCIFVCGRHIKKDTRRKHIKGHITKLIKEDTKRRYIKGHLEDTKRGHIKGGLDKSRP